MPQDKTAPDQWQYQILARILSRNKVIVVTGDCDLSLIREMKIPAVSSVGEALEIAFDTVGADGRIAVVPDGVSVIVSGD